MLDRCLEALHKCREELQVALSDFFLLLGRRHELSADEARQLENVREVIFGGLRPNEFTRRIAEAVESIEAFVRPHLR